jgi:hypothetical protein
MESLLDIILESASPSVTLLVGKQGTTGTIIDTVADKTLTSHRFSRFQLSSSLETQLHNFITAQSIDEMFAKVKKIKVAVFEDIDTWSVIPNIITDTMRSPRVHMIVSVEKMRKVPKVVKLAHHTIYTSVKNHHQDAELLERCRSVCKLDFDKVRYVVSNDGISISNTIYESMIGSQVPLRTWISGMVPLHVWSNNNFDQNVLEIYLLCVVYMIVITGKVIITEVSTIPSRYANASFMSKRNALQCSKEFLTRYDQLAMTNTK